MSIITRFAPSPTGHMHIGNCRTALFSYLWALHERLNGDKEAKFILRIEDTDKERSNQEYVHALCQDLSVLGIKWDIGPDPDPEKEKHRNEQERAEYTQSLRTNIYHKYYNQLIEQGLAYPCFCSEAMLKMTRKRQMAAGEPPRYSGTCRSLSNEEVEQKLAAGEEPVLRFKVDDNAVIEFVDKVKGKQKFLGKNIGDFVIRKGSKGYGETSFMFANAVDDALMSVTLVVRGEDHLSNSPYQIMILQALGLPVPEYAHISLITGNDGAPLSKRNGNMSIQELLNLKNITTEDSYLPDAITNYLARLGNAYTSEELLSIEDMAKEFNPDKLSKSSANYDQQHLIFWQNEAIYHPLRDIAKLPKFVKDAIVERLSNVDKMGDLDLEQFTHTIKYNVQFYSDLIRWADLLSGRWDVSQLDFGTVNADKEIYAQAAELAKGVKDDSAEDLKKGWHHITAQISSSTERKGKRLFKPLRLALSGVDYGPPLEDIFTLLGKERAAKRFEKATRMCD